MFKQKIFIYSFVVLIIIGIFQYLGCRFDVYYIYPLYDIPMHVLGGLWVSLFTLSIYNYYFKNNHNAALCIVLCVLLSVIISWEIFEIVGKIQSFTDQGYWLDTFGDILNGFIGGAIGYFLYLKK